MASSQKIEYNCMADVKARLEAAGLSNVIVEHDERPESATFTRVRCINLRNDVPLGNTPSGMRQADMAVECNSYYHDDTDGAALHALVEDAREALYVDTILSLLNTLSTYNTYYGFVGGDDLPDEQDGFRLISQQFSLVFKPST